MCRRMTSCAGAINDEMGTALKKNADLADRLNKEEQEKAALQEKLDCAETTLKLRMADEKALLECVLRRVLAFTTPMLSQVLRKARSDAKCI